MVGDKDTYDGLLDISHASDFVTVSWCKVRTYIVNPLAHELIYIRQQFSDHWKGSLIGHSDNNASEDTGKLHVCALFLCLLVSDIDVSSVSRLHTTTIHSSVYVCIFRGAW